MLKYRERDCCYFTRFGVSNRYSLDAKKVTKKNQGQPEPLRAFVRQRRTFDFKRKISSADNLTGKKIRTRGIAVKNLSNKIEYLKTFCQEMLKQVQHDDI